MIIKKWVRLCISKSVMLRAILTAMVVGAILVGINYGDVILRGQLDTRQWLRIFLTILVPYAVSTVSSVLAIFNMEKEEAR
jgi:uncharacterized membrane protein YwzB